MMYLSALRAQARTFLGKFAKTEEGVTAIEYAIVAAGVAAVVSVIFKGQAGGPVYDMLANVYTQLQNKVTSMLATSGGNGGSGNPAF
jgi:pilus assembly protein Flp/PilA